MTKKLEDERGKKILLICLILFGLVAYHTLLLRALHPDSLDGRLRLETWMIDHNMRGNPIVLSQLVPSYWDAVIVFEPYRFRSLEDARARFQTAYGVALPLTPAMLDEGAKQFLVFLRGGRVVRLLPNHGSSGYFITAAKPLTRENAVFIYYHDPVFRTPVLGLRHFD